MFIETEDSKLRECNVTSDKMDQPHLVAIVSLKSDLSSF